MTGSWRGAFGGPAIELKFLRTLASRLPHGKEPSWPLSLLPGPTQQLTAGNLEWVSMVPELDAWCLRYRPNSWQGSRDLCTTREMSPTFHVVSGELGFHVMEEVWVFSALCRPTSSCRSSMENPAQPPWVASPPRWWLVGISCFSQRPAEAIKSEFKLVFGVCGGGSASSLLPLVWSEVKHLPSVRDKGPDVLDSMNGDGVIHAGLFTEKGQGR